MASTRLELKIISIIQLVMAVIFFVLGMVDHFEVRYMYASFTLMPCWIAVLVLPVGITGLVLVNRPRPSSALMNGLCSVSIACAAVAAITIERYAEGLNYLLAFKYFDVQYHQEKFSLFVDKDSEIKFKDEENTMIAIHVLVIIFSIFEIILAVATARSSDVGYQSAQENLASAEYSQLEVAPLMTESDQETD